LGVDESGVTMEEQAEKLVLYFVHLLRYQNGFENNEEVNAKLFNPVPVHGIKRFHMDIDGEILYYLLKDCKVTLPQHSAVDEKCMNAKYFVRDGLHVDYFNKYFSVQQFETENSKSFNYSNGISTDNVVLNILLKKNENIEAGVTQRRKKQHRHLSGTFCMSRSSVAFICILACSSHILFDVARLAVVKEGHQVKVIILL
jgi:hypothetical protein